VDEVVAERDLEDGPVALGDLDLAGAAVAQGVQPDAVDGEHFVRGRAEVGVRCAPEDDRADDVARAGRVVVEPAEGVAGREAQAELLVDLAQRGVERGLALVDTSAGQSPLAGVLAQARSAAAQQERRAAGDADHATVERTAVARTAVAGHDRHVDVGGEQGIAVVALGVAVDEHDGHRGVPAALERVGPALVLGEPRGDAGPQLGGVGDHRPGSSRVAVRGHGAPATRPVRRRTAPVGSAACPATPSAPRSSATTSTPPSACWPRTRSSTARRSSRPYEGRDAVATILRAAYATFEDFRYTDELTGTGVHGLVFTARVGDKTVQGIDLIRGDADGRIKDFTVMLRPASGLMAVAERMGAALEAAGVRAPR
jgi:hypothetical protein